jgi:CheY-like chemotaxis protein
VRIPSILFLEDDVEVRAEVALLLNSNGYQVFLVVDEKEALDLLGTQDCSVDLILLEQRMPSEKALELGRRLRKHPRVIKDAPVVVLPLEFVDELEGVIEKVGDNEYKAFIDNSQHLQKFVAGLLGGNGRSKSTQAL